MCNWIQVWEQNLLVFTEDFPWQDVFSLSMQQLLFQIQVLSTSYMLSLSLISTGRYIPEYCVMGAAFSVSEHHLFFSFDNFRS